MIFKKFENQKIYVLCPPMFKTGGTELLHQLVFNLNSFNLNALITYNTIDFNNVSIPSAFLQYVKTFATITEIEDRADNILIVPEVYIGVLNKFNYIQKCIWWLSVDNFCYYKDFITRYRQRGALSAIKRKFFNENKLVDSVIKKCFNLYQSFYAKNFLNELCINDNIYYLSDYINELYFSSNNIVKENIVVYNPAKGYKYLKKIIKKSKNLNWVPIVNMSNEEVKKLLNAAKVYIDFGNHPGKDRIPREAAISGCCVITNCEGAAKFYDDVPIPDRYKFCNMNDYNAIIYTINDCLNNYEKNIVNFDNYKKIILEEKSIFINDLKKIFM